MYEQYAKNALKEVVKTQHTQQMPREIIEKYIDKEIVKEAFDEIESKERIDREKSRRKDRTKFIITKDHLNLLNFFYVDWQDVEYGAPCIDPKRPYGNSDVNYDIRKILGKKISSQQCRELHEDMEIALQIFLKNAKLKTGEYIRNDQYSINWKQSQPNATREM